MNLYHWLTKKFRYIIWFIFIIFFPLFAYSQDSINISNHVPVNKIFYKFGKNIIGSYKYNFGLNYFAACAGTFALIGSDFDWHWYKFSIRNDNRVYNIGYPAVYTGWIVPFTVPLSLYAFGCAEKNTNLQITGLALGQAALDGWIISTTMKIFTGRVPPIKLRDHDDILGDFRFGFLKGGANDGWPSSHTTTAFAMAAALTELYPDNMTVKICSFTYATAIGLGVSTNIHWFSDTFAGALIGYAIGKTVGMSYRNLMNNYVQNKLYSFYVTPSGVVFNYRF